MTEVGRVDLVANPLPIAEYLARPLTRRGRWMMQAIDNETGEFRLFYESSFKHNFRECPLRIGERNDRGKLIPISRGFAPTVPDRIALANVLRNLHRDDIFVYADDLRLIEK